MPSAFNFATSSSSCKKMDNSNNQNERTIVVVTGNDNKLREVKKILGQSCPYKIESVKHDLPEYQGDEDFIVTKKCEAAHDYLHRSVLVEDTSLAIDCLGGLPGPYVKYFLDKIGSDGLVQMIEGWENKRATIRCLLGFFDDESRQTHVFKGEIHGHLVKPRGTSGFGFDNCFQPDGFDKTLAELGPEVKDRVSHRYLALKAFKEYIEANRN